MSKVLSFSDLKGDYRERYKVLLAKFTEDADTIIEEFRADEVAKLQAKAETLSSRPVHTLKEDRKALTGAEALLNLEEEGEIIVTVEHTDAE
jgi:hypothetical protein